MMLRSSKFFIGILIFFSILNYRPDIIESNTRKEINEKVELIRREKEVLIEEQKKLEEELMELNRESQSLGSAVKSLDVSRKKLLADIKITQSKIKATDLNIKYLEQNVQETMDQILNHEKAIAHTIKSISNGDRESLVFSILSSANFSDVWRDRAEKAKFSLTLANDVSSLKEKREFMSKEREMKIKSKEKIVTFQKELNGQKSVVEENQNAKKRLLAQTKSLESEYRDLLAQNLAKQKQFEEDLFKLESGLNISLDPSLIPPPRNGLLAWPLEKVFVTQRFGKTAGSARLYASGTHNGVDFRASQGTPVLAMLSGFIVETGNTDEQKGCGSYGRWILIKHPNGLSSIYSHLSSTLVKKGEEVKTGDVIGYSGGTPGTFGAGYSTGPHLHVGLFASQGVAVRQFVESRGCKEVRVPIADIKAYLDPLAYLPSL